MYKKPIANPILHWQRLATHDNVALGSLRQLNLADIRKAAPGKPTPLTGRNFPCRATDFLRRDTCLAHVLLQFSIVQRRPIHSFGTSLACISEHIRGAGWKLTTNEP